MPSTPSRTSIVTLGFTALLVFITGYLLSSLVSPQSIFPDGLRVFDRSPLDVVTGILSEELGRVRKRDEDEEMPAKGPLINTKNVLGKPLGFFSDKPMTGFYRDGYCRVGPEDAGNHSVAATVTDEFLDFSASRGNDLRKIGLTGGCKWCLCASRWKEALDARKSDDDPVVPKVYLHATHESALNTTKMEDLKKFAAEGEAKDSNKQVITPSGGRPSAAVKETH